MNPPKDTNELLRHLHCGTIKPDSMLDDRDEAYFARLAADVRNRRQAIVIVSQPDGSYKYMFSQDTRGEAVSIIGEVLKHVGKQVIDKE